MTAMSKLKRKKSVIGESGCEQQTTIKKSNSSLSAEQDSKTSTVRTRWWESSDLSDVERLWALTLRAFCPALQSDEEECVPPLPLPSSKKTTVQKVGDWRWCTADEDINPPPDLPTSSFFNNPPPVNGVKNPPQPPTVENTEECSPPAIAYQENHAFSPDQESVSVCDVQTAQQHHIEDKVNCIEGRELLDEQRDKFDQVGKVSETQEVTRGSGAGLDVESGAGKRAKTGAGASGSWLRTMSKAEGSVSGIGTKQGAGGSGSGQKAKSGAGQRAKSGVRGSALVLGAKSEVGLDADSGAGKGVKTGSGSRLRTISEAVSSMGTKRQASGSGSGQRAKSGLETNSRESGSGLGKGTKSGLNLEKISGTEDSGAASGSGLKTKVVSEGSGAATGSGLGIKTEIERSRLAPESELETTSGAASGSGLECCPMCLMPFPAGFTQMQCDSHLAQCLSEMHEDIIW
ncbi:uncharacterized protein si:ch73-70k4.1 [Puntigrus tetrazona]|uniref:uncharacterized protein si:ch73-70k4.1 n=1 Tax=Puntigrus tetrazona TaxID=1606681 RepID=UPI001C8AEB39|nr:uncharacterized protein si:ch73-70k4.1 [Puntigrus tetrazona]